MIQNGKILDIACDILKVGLNFYHSRRRGFTWRYYQNVLRAVRVDEAGNRYRIRQCPSLYKFCRTELSTLQFPELWLLAQHAIRHVKPD